MFQALGVNTLVSGGKFSSRAMILGCLLLHSSCFLIANNEQLAKADFHPDDAETAK